MAEAPIRLVAFDMEGCLTADPTVWELMHRKWGTWHSHGEPYWRRFQAGEFGYDAFARMDVAVWAGAPEALLVQAACEVPLMPGCAEVLQTLAARGVGAAVISNGLDCVARRFREEFGVRHVCANRAQARDGVLTGRLALRVPYGAKGAVLEGLMGRLGLTREEVAAVGDGAQDVAMFRCARIAVAFRSRDPAVLAAATHHLPDADLRPLLDILR